MRLILQDGDSKRGLRLKDGTFSIGSAESCKITLTADGVAEHHADLVVKGGSVQIVPQGEGHAVLVGDETVSGAADIEVGQSFAIGGAQFELKGDGAAPAKTKAPVTRGRAGASPRPAAGKPQRVERSARQPRGQSFPTWLILLLAVPAVLIAYKMFGAVVTTDEAGGFSEKTSRIRIEEALAESDADGALKELAWVEKHAADLTPEWNLIFDRLEDQANNMNEETTSTVNVMEGEQYIERRLDKFKGRYLQRGTRPEAREYVRRADKFLKQFAGHPDEEQVKRQRDHFAKWAKPEEPATVEDLICEVHFLADGKPRDYITARRRIAEFQARTDEGSDEINTRLTEMDTQEKEYYEEQLDLAAGLWERGEGSQSLSKLMMLLSGLSNSAYSDDVARRITEMDGVLNALEGYHREQSSFLKKCANANPNFAAFLKKNDLN